ncbi:MAG: hypothetical protein FJX77_10905, partial [Armatimonadetes bacterium]|nr:hypothetical protein [Armatimonadota bacterium]
MLVQRPFLLPTQLALPEADRRRLARDHDRFREGLPADLRAYCREEYGVDIAGEYAGQPIANPFGKASG